MGFHADLATVSSENIRKLHAYWDRLRRGRLMPARADIDPAEIKPLLPMILITDVQHDPLRIRYRLVGTVVAERSRQEFTGRYLDELHFSSSEDWLGLYHHILAQRRPVFGTSLMPLWENKQPTKPYEYAAFPLSSDGITVDGVLGIEDYDSLLRKSPAPEMSAR